MCDSSPSRPFSSYCHLVIYPPEVLFSERRPLSVVLVLRPQRVAPCRGAVHLDWTQKAVVFPADFCAVWIDHSLTLPHAAPLIAHCPSIVVCDADWVPAAVTLDFCLSHPVFHGCKHNRMYCRLSSPAYSPASAHNRFHSSYRHRYS